MSTPPSPSNVPDFPTFIATSPSSSRLQNFPVSWFSVIMGMAGFSVAWARAEHILRLPFALSPLLQGLTVTLFTALSVIYCLKIFRFPKNVMAEINHPVKIAFLPTFSISLILISIIFVHSRENLSFYLWVTGTIIHFCMTLYVLSSWIHQNKYEIKHLNPAWFIPVVGNILVPVAGVQHASPDISWFFFSIGLFFWPVLTGIIFYRLIFHQSLPERFVPTLFIFIAPPSVACISWYNMTGSLGVPGKILYFIALFFFTPMVVQALLFPSLPFLFVLGGPAPIPRCCPHNCDTDHGQRKQLTRVYLGGYRTPHRTNSPHGHSAGADRKSNRRIKQYVSRKIIEIVHCFVYAGSTHFFPQENTIFDIQPDFRAECPPHNGFFPHKNKAIKTPLPKNHCFHQDDFLAMSLIFQSQSKCSVSITFEILLTNHQPAYKRSFMG